SINYGQRKLLFAKDYIVNHNSDGNKPLFNISAYYPINFSNYGEATANQSISLPKINRLSVSSAISGVLGNAVTITINRYSTSFTHNLKYDFKGSTGTIATGVGTSYLWTIPPTFANLLPNELTGTGNLIVETMDGSAKIGETKYTLSITIPNTATYKPKLSSITLSDTNTLTSSIVSGNNFVRIISKVKVDFGSAIGNNGSTITSYNAEIVGKSNSIIGNGSVFDKLDFFGSATIRATVTDSRGLTSEPVDTKINVIDYFLPIVTSAKVVRSQQNPDILQVLPFVKIAPIIVGGIQKNQLKMSVSVAPYNTGIYAVDSGAATNTWSTISQMSGAPLNLGGTYDKSKSWLVKVSVSDSLMSAIPITQTISSEFVLVTKAPSGVAFGKIWEHGIIDAKGDVYVDGTIYCGDKPIQQKQLALNNGGSFRHDDTDLNSLQDTGFYCVFRGANRPVGAGPGYVTVVRHQTANYAYQQFYDRTNKTIFTRVLENGVWSGWSEYVKKDSLPTTIDSGWQSIGNGFSYRQTGSTVTVKYNFATNGIDKLTVGSMPTNLIPSDMMFAVTAWTIQLNVLNVQVSADGRILWFNPSKWTVNVKGQIQWTI
ncbi:prophage LambdaSa1, minor structural protein, partial [Streptococcus agalactiae]